MSAQNAPAKPVPNLTPAQVKLLRETESAPVLIDVREPWEFALASVTGAQLHPLGNIQEWAQTLDKSTRYLVMCHHGARSMMACQYLRALGFADVSNVDGGIDAWSVTVDATVPRY
jgi:rhodanese-related sulfurtransferase